jgi:hypothetical protein
MASCLAIVGCPPNETVTSRTSAWIAPAQVRDCQVELRQRSRELLRHAGEPGVFDDIQISERHRRHAPGARVQATSRSTPPLPHLPR